MSNSIWDSVKELFSFDSSDPGSSIAEDITTRFNRGLGYVKGRFDAFKDDWTPPALDESKRSPKVLPAIPLQNTPLWQFIRIGSGVDSPEQKLLQKGAEKGLANLEAVRQYLEQTDAFYGNSGMLTGMSVKVLSDAGILPSWMDENYSISGNLVLNKMQQREEALQVKTGDYRHRRLQDQTRTIITGLNAIEPLLVVGAALKPKYAKRLMGIHLISDALTGVLNFRTPGRPEGYGVSQVAAPYAFMSALAVGNKLTGGMF